MIWPSFYSQIKAAIMAQESPNPWTSTLPAVLLGVRSAIKELLGRSDAEMVYGTTLRLSGELTEQYTVDARTDLDNYFDKLRVVMSRLRLCPPRDTIQKDICSNIRNLKHARMYFCDESQLHRL